MPDQQMMKVVVEGLSAGSFINSVVQTAVGGVVALVGAYIGAVGLEAWKERRREKTLDGPRKNLLRSMLTDSRFKARRINTLCVATGCAVDDCRRLLISIEARGVTMEDGSEGWGLISKNPLSEE